eukprot:CAMPEP_0114501220 /NCGR_PEP_ID=MMETSP0109-20121206/8381_1 /TAXON_ID=29199 /ORGANISM="Chlorarachnion reptans, Strain CCCM449" /LENGTH=484 /DNA_ID=CAMNT_0001678933 /DNA_START=23 /DNA_END=1477 /DNA_ORIENTATION=-
MADGAANKGEELADGVSSPPPSSNNERQKIDHSNEGKGHEQFFKVYHTSLFCGESLTEFTWTAAPGIACVAVHELRTNSPFFGLLILSSFIAYQGFVLKFGTERAKEAVWLNLNARTRQTKILRALFIALVITLIRPNVPGAYNLTTTMARTAFCRTVTTNIIILHGLFFSDADFEWMLGGKMRLQDLLPLVLLYILVVDRYAFGMLWQFPSTVFNWSMIMGYACAFMSKRIIRHWERTEEISFCTDLTRRRHAAIAIFSFQVLCYVSIPVLFSAKNDPQIESSTIMEFPSGRSLLLPDEICSSIMENRISNETFIAVFNFYTGWKVSADVGLIIYEYLREASPWRSDSLQILREAGIDKSNDGTGMMSCNFADSVVWEYVNGIRGAKRFSSTIATQFSTLQTAMSYLKQIGTFLTAALSVVSALWVSQDKGKPHLEQNEDKPRREDHSDNEDGLKTRSGLENKSGSDNTDQSDRISGSSLPVS